MRLALTRTTRTARHIRPVGPEQVDNAPAMLQGLQPLVRSWRPDLIVHDTAEFAAPVAAATAGIPSISHTLGLRLEGDVLDRIAEAVAPLWRRQGREPDPTAGVYRHLCLDIMPPSLQPAQPSRCAGAIRALRPSAAAPALNGEQLPAWMASRRPVPLVYMTLGTWTNSDVSMFRSMVDGLADVAVDVLLAVGPGNDPAAIGPLPANAHVEQYVAQSLLLPECAVVVCHGGAGTTLGALACGLPLDGRYWFAVRPQGVAHGFPVLVVDASGRVDLALTLFAREAGRRKADSTARTYQYALLPLFTFLAHEPAAPGTGGPLSVVRQAVEDYLVDRLGCQVDEPLLGYRVVTRSGSTPSTILIFLSGLKLLYLRADRTEAGQMIHRLSLRERLAARAILIR